jgi:hypothetical protein
MAERFELRRAEIEAEAHVRICAVEDPGGVGDPTYAEGLRAALPAAFDYALAGLNDGEGDGEAIPIALLGQARLAARRGVSLGTVLRRYFAGYTLFSDFMIQEAQGHPMSGSSLQRLMRVQAERFDRLIVAITEVHYKEWAYRLDSTEERRTRQVERLLDGEFVTGEELDYDFRLTHMGLVAAGLDGATTIRNLAREVDCRLLLVRPDQGMAWGWLGSSRGVDADRVRMAAGYPQTPDSILALGEPAQGFSGWRLTHGQAKAALVFGMRCRESIVRYRDVLLIAPTLGDDVYAGSLRQLFLEPLMNGRDGGAALLETLRAYLAVGRNASSAAAALGVSRQTVINRLDAVEQRLGRQLDSCAPELEAALRLEELDRRQGDPDDFLADVPANRVLQDVKASLGPLDTSSTRAPSGA